MTENTIKIGVGLAALLIPSLTVGFDNMWAWFGIFAIIHVAYGFTKAAVADWVKSREAKAPTNLPTYGEEPMRQQWINTDSLTGEGREALDIEVPLEVRKWAEGSNEWTDHVFDRDGSIVIVIGAVPNLTVNEDTPNPFHVAYTMSKQMDTLLFIEMVNSFNSQVPVLLASQGMTPEVQDGD